MTREARGIVLGASALGALVLGGLLLLGGGEQQAPAVPASVEVSPSTIAEDRVVEVTAVLNSPAGPGGVAVKVSTSEPGLVTPTEERGTVPAGERRITVSLTAGRTEEPRRTRVVATANGVSTTAELTVIPRTYAAPERTGAFDAARVPEASGVAASRRNPGWLYLVDDEQPREIWALRPDSGRLQSVPLDGFVGRDTEDLAVAPCGRNDPEFCVYVGDIGDNVAGHPDVAILRFPEPDLSAPLEAVAPDVIRVRYPNGPVDAEALLVDDEGVPHVVTKESVDGRSAARLFAAPGFADGTLTLLGTVAVPDPQQPWATAVLGTLVTGGDHHDGRVLLRTYDSVVEYVAPEASAPLSDFASWPAREVPSAREPQGEAVGFAADGCGYYTVGEMLGDIWFIDCR